MRTDVLGKAVRAQGGAVVKPHQVKAMILAARRAYLEQAKLGLVDDGVGFDAWRRATLHDVVGAAAPSSFRAVTQRDYVAVLRYFGELAGESGAPRTSRPTNNGGMNAAPLVADRFAAPCGGGYARDKTADERRRALWALNLEEGRLEDFFGGRDGAARYADALFEKIHETSRLTATARQVWAVIFTLRNRAAKRRTRTGLGALGASGVPSSPPEGSERFPAFSRAL